MRHLGVICAALLLLAGCGSANAGAGKTTAAPKIGVYGTLDLNDFNGIDYTHGAAHSWCSGKSGYSDIAQGAQVVVRDASGKTLGLGVLSAGELSGQVYDPGTACEFTFRISGIATRDGILSVEVTHRGQVQFKRSEASDVHVTLGG